MARWAGLLTCAVALAGCAGSGSGAAVSLPASSASGASTPAAAGASGVSAPGAGTSSPQPREVDPLAAVDRGDPMAVYRAWWGAVARALATADPTSPELAALATDPLLSQTRQAIAALRAQGIVQVVRFDLHPRLLSRSGTQAEIADCVGTPPGSYRDARTGRPRAPAGYANDRQLHDSLRFLLEFRPGGWYVVVATTAEGGAC